MTLLPINATLSPKLAAYNATDTELQQLPLIWSDIRFPPHRTFTYESLDEFLFLLATHRTRDPSPTLAGILTKWAWYVSLLADFYAQIQATYTAHADLPVWPNYLDTDIAFMFHRMLNHKRILGALFLYYGNATTLEPKRNLWADFVGAVSEETILYGSAFYMAPEFRKFIRDVQTTMNAVDLTFLGNIDTMLQNIYLPAEKPLNVNVAAGAKYFVENGKYMELVEGFMKENSEETLRILNEMEASAYSKCAWSGITIMLTIAGGLLNMFAIRTFVSHFVMEVKDIATEHKNKTLDLRMERRKTNMVLHSMLPRKVADELKFRKFVRPTYHESVSLYFSDVQGFTALSSRSTPEEIVVMLTELYTGFDDILNSYRVWKLETIGDAYCIIAGATNQDDFNSPMEHAMEMVNCSLSIRDFIRHFPIPHIPDEVVQIRIGVHTGSIVAGVAGVGMHRYCVAGDALSIVERVEAAGKHGRVHISESTKRALFPVRSSESISSGVSESEPTSADHPNYALYTVFPNPAEEVELEGQIIKTFWIDRRKSPIERQIRASFVKRPSTPQLETNEVNTGRPVHGLMSDSESDPQPIEETSRLSRLGSNLLSAVRYSVGRLSPEMRPRSSRQAASSPVESTASQLELTPSVMELFSTEYEGDARSPSPRSTDA
ncbi:uncharacterized protein LOC129595595 isoform X2 [Paramacrobiotus metropolitanus]|uniref:uncharacterized protein LOC129595595 isoform X2 n=1 Tax=Paramacrobiotus metropolitanus TaxID=2943436 RepID=UPI0024459B20|nr:uncharacterized protein LOC129595595 isoform X2 [Paramacrobiotus metropolitanus]